MASTTVGELMDQLRHYDPNAKVRLLIHGWDLPTQEAEEDIYTNGDTPGVPHVNIVGTGE